MSQRHLQAIDYLREETRVLREQVGRRAFDSTTISVAAFGYPGQRAGTQASGGGDYLTPETLLAWHRKLIAQQYAGGKRGLGRPRTPGEIETFWFFLVRMAEEYRDWGLSAHPGALSNLGHELARSTIGEMLKRHGIMK
jgi:hypothetical protein